MLDFSPSVIQKALTISGQRARGSPKNINVIFEQDNFNEEYIFYS